MTDLIKQLQYLSRVTKDYDQEHMTSADYEMIPAVTKLAEDRIEELERELCDMNALYGQVKDGLEAKLAKAVEVLQLYAGGVTSAVYARTVLAELEDWE